MAKTVTVIKRASGAFQVTVAEDGTTIYSKPFPAASFTVQYNAGNDNIPKIKLVPATNREEPIMTSFHAPTEWTVGVVTGFTTVEEVADEIMTLSNS